ncbi:hypothetical protein C6H68_04860 [Photorhabdus luminescens]|nr:hypothetical protein C6H68_04860 [Photorhabdus luminescens]
MEKFYKNRFFMVGLKDMSFDKDIVSISIFTEHFDDNSILKKFKPGINCRCNWLSFHLNE